jgi:hypothetical protein
VLLLPPLLPPLLPLLLPPPPPLVVLRCWHWGQQLPSAGLPASAGFASTPRQG